MVTRGKVVEILKTQLDPELGIDVHTLGFVYGIDLDEKAQELKLRMTLTTPLCPFGPIMIRELKKKFLAAGLKKADIELVFDPPWKPSQEVRQLLGL